jgi:hypothetical protein
MNRRQKKKATAKWYVKNRDRLLLLSQGWQSCTVCNDRDVWLLGNRVHNIYRWWKRGTVWMSRKAQAEQKKDVAEYVKKFLSVKIVANVPDTSARLELNS